MNVLSMLSPGANRCWHDKGWALVPRFLERRKLTTLRAEADRLVTETRLFAERGGIPNSPTRSDRLDPVIDVSPVFERLANEPALLGIVGEFLDGTPQLMKDKFIAKPPGAAGYATHQDAAYWPGLGIDGRQFLTAILFLDDSPSERGAIECSPGHHRHLLTDPDSIADPDERFLSPFEPVEAGAGDLLLLGALTPHRSGRNLSDAMRRTLLFTYGIDPRPGLYERYRRLRLRADV